jgi:hypothetical protein
MCARDTLGAAGQPIWGKLSALYPKVFRDSAAFLQHSAQTIVSDYSHVWRVRDDFVMETSGIGKHGADTETAGLEL